MSIIPTRRFAIAVFLSTTSWLSVQGAEDEPPNVAKSEDVDCAFSYSHIGASDELDDVLSQIEKSVVPKLTKSGATLYAIWTPVANSKQFPERGKFKGLDHSELILMLAWPKESVHAKELDTALKSLRGLKTVNTRILDTIFLAKRKNGFGVPTPEGFYVHRENHYPPEDVGKVVQLSKEAWKLWDHFWGTQVIGLFRDRSEGDKVAKLVRITWYPNQGVWESSHDRTNKDPKVVAIKKLYNKIFKDRIALRVPGSPSEAFATDRLVR